MCSSVPVMSVKIPFGDLCLSSIIQDEEPFESQSDDLVVQLCNS